MSCAQSARTMATYPSMVTALNMIVADTPRARMQMVQPLQTKRNVACAQAPCIYIKEAVTRAATFTPGILFARNVIEGFARLARLTSSKTLLRRKRLTRVFGAMTQRGCRAMWVLLIVYDVRCRLILK